MLLMLFMHTLQSQHKDYVILHFPSCFLIVSLFLEHLGPFHSHVTLLSHIHVTLLTLIGTRKPIYSLSKGYPRPPPGV